MTLCNCTAPPKSQHYFGQLTLLYFSKVERFVVQETARQLKAVSPVDGRSLLHAEELSVLDDRFLREFRSYRSGLSSQTTADLEQPPFRDDCCGLPSLTRSRNGSERLKADHVE